MKNMEYDVVIIGAGISGACIARELSKTTARVCLLDKEDDVSCGTSKANSGIVHAGYDPEPGSLMAKYNVRGAELFADLAQKLHFDYKQIGSLVLAFDDDGLAKLKVLLERGKKNGVKKLKILNRAQLEELEPNLSEEALGALYAPTAAITSPYQATWAIAESAVINGVTFLRNTAVHSITPPAPSSKTAGKKDDDKSPSRAATFFTLSTTAGEIKAKYVVNAAGLKADEISRMAGARDYRIIQRKGEYCLLDNKCINLVNHVLFQTPGPLGKGVLVTRTVDGNILIGPSADAVSKDTIDYTGTTAASQEAILKAARRSVPDIPQRNIINSFAGIRAIAVEPDGTPINDFIIEEDATIRGFINVGGICSPGLTSAPAIGEAVVDLLKKAGLKVSPAAHFIEEREGIPSFKLSSQEEKLALIKKDKRYGQIICRCEMITEGEIVAAIHSPIGAVDLDGVKRRTRAGMGRCQAGFCSPRVTEILSRELQIPMINITKRGGTSYVLDSKTRPCVPEVAK
ncbi:MAG: NAD(P)/FAD-dependent oxidoreductase [Treponema sp.]|nr:NAD(P)/FAD-dependent oxidoreductase [Treponema sp.]